MINLAKLFETQKLLDKRIVDEHNLHGHDLLPQKILALQVELAELANEWREFKFWSRDQEPRTFEWIGKCEKCNGHGVDDENISCPNCAGTGDGNRNPLLEEYVDCLHFILSIGNDISLSNVLVKNLEGEFKDMLECFRHCNNWVVNLDYTLHETACYISTIEKVYENLISVFLELGEMLGFTPEQIEQSYYEKNAINHQRQTDKY